MTKWIAPRARAFLAFTPSRRAKSTRLNADLSRNAFSRKSRHAALRFAGPVAFVRCFLISSAFCEGDRSPGTGMLSEDTALLAQTSLCRMRHTRRPTSRKVTLEPQLFALNFIDNLCGSAHAIVASSLRWQQLASHDRYAVFTNRQLHRLGYSMK